MRRKKTFLIALIGILVLCAAIVSAQDSLRREVVVLLAAEGVDPDEARRILQDSRISLSPEIVIKNLFYSSPKGSAQNPDVMDIDPRQIEQGKTFMEENEAVLSAVEKRFGVSARIITAILLIESRLGTYPMPYNVVNAYANLAFLADPVYFKEIQDRFAGEYPQLLEEASIARAKRKAKWAASELAYLIHLANHLDVDPFSITGSFAGAMGPAQFIPSSFWIFGLDGDGDGLASPFNMTDATLSMGHYLHKYGWREDAPIEQKRKALWYYNHSKVYVNTVLMIYDTLNRNR